MNIPRPAALAAAGIVVTPVLIAVSIALAADASGADADIPAVSSPACAAGEGLAVSVASVSSLASGQIGNARIIYDVAVNMALPSKAAVIAIATAMQESGLENLPYGDRDSLGLFQQRPSQGWGTRPQILNPVYAATAFYRSLIQVPDWQQLPLAVAAQDVQHSADPGAYARWQPLATSLVSRFSATNIQCLASDGRGAALSGSAQLPAGYSIPAGTPAPVVAAIDYAVAQLGKPYVWGGTGPDGYDCSGLVMVAYRAGGIDLPRTTYQQVLTGTAVYGISQMLPGDLLFTAGSDGTAANPGHVGMYIGDGLVIDAPQTGQDIEVTRLGGYWSGSAVAIRRLTQGDLLENEHCAFPQI